MKQRFDFEKAFQGSILFAHSIILKGMLRKTDGKYNSYPLMTQKLKNDRDNLLSIAAVYKYVSAQSFLK